MASLYEAEMGPELRIRGTEDVVGGLVDDEAYDFLGLEDPNLWRDREAGTVHLYCTFRSSTGTATTPASIWATRRERT